VIEEQFAETLVRSGRIAPAQRAAAVEAAGATGTRFAAAVRRLGLVDDDSLQAGMRELVEHLLASSLEWTDGSFEFVAGQPNLEGEVTVDLSPVVLLIEHTRRFPIHLDAVRSRIGPPDARPVAHTAGVPAIEAAGDEGLLLLLQRCDGTLSVPEIAASSSAGEEAALRGLLALTLLGAITVDRQTSAATKRGAAASPLQREECAAILQRINAPDHYAVLGLTRESPADEIRRSYYALARRYHPDRFRAGALTDLLPRFEHFFTRVTEAYNTLFNPESRALYDQQIQAPAESEGAKLSETANLAKQNFLRGKALVEKRRFADAATFLENAVRMDPGQAAYHLEFGLVLARNPRRRGDAERHLLRAVEMEPTRTSGYVALGEMYQRAGKAAHAARMYREALRWEPDLIEAARLLREVENATEEVDFLRPVFEG
jgi:tetratricopeptide (TPR) repeat protein